MNLLLWAICAGTSTATVSEVSATEVETTTVSSSNPGASPSFDLPAEDTLPEEPADIEVVVTAARAPRSRKDATVATEVISHDEIEASGAQSLDELLEERPGIQIQRSFRGAGIELQGLDARYVLVLVDGERAVGRVDGVLDLSRFNLDNIERVEIVKGAGSAVYGSDAIAGVVNIITKKPSKRFEVEGKGQYGSRNSADVSASGAWKGELLSARVGAGFHRADGFDLDTSTPATSGSAFTTWLVDGRGDLSLGSKSGVTLRAEYQRSDRDRVDEGAGGAVFDRRNLVETLAVGASGNFDLETTRFVVRASGSFFRDQLNYDQRGGTQQDRYQDTRERGLALDLQLDHTFSPQHLSTLGADSILEHLETDRIKDGRSDRSRIAPYLQHEWRVFDSPRWTLLPGIRADFDSQFGSSISPRLATRFDVIEGLMIRGSVGKGFRAPDFRELYLIFENPAAGYVILGNEGLDPETSVSLSGAVEARLIKDVTVIVSVFRNEIKNLITPISEGPAQEGQSQSFRYQNVAKANVQGIEANLEVRPLRGLKLEGTYAWNDTFDEETGGPLEGRASHKVTAGVRWVLPFDGEVSARGQWVSSRPFYFDDNGDGVLEERRADPFTTLDLRAAQHFGDWLEVFAGIDNVTDAGDVQFLQLAPRTFYAGASGRASVF